MQKTTFFIRTTLLVAMIVSFSQEGLCQVFKYDAKGKRDPFVPLIGIERAKVSGLEDVISVEDVRFEGIAVGPAGKKTVVMNGIMLKEGDSVGSVKVVKIGDKAVTLLISGAKYDINLSSKEGGGTK